MTSTAISQNEPRSDMPLEAFDMPEVAPEETAEIAGGTRPFTPILTPAKWSRQVQQTYGVSHAQLLEKQPKSPVIHQRLARSVFVFGLIEFCHMNYRQVGDYLGCHLAMSQRHRDKIIRLLNANAATTRWLEPLRIPHK